MSNHLDLNEENRGLILRGAANAWNTRCKSLGLRSGTKGRQRELEAFLQGVLAVATAARVIARHEADIIALQVMVGRGEEVIDQWAAFRTDAEAAEDCRLRCHGAASEQLAT